MRKRVDGFVWSMTPLLLIAAGGTVAPASHRTTDFKISIRNGMGHAMDFSYVDIGSTTEHALGTVPGYDRKDFTIVNPATDSVIIVEKGDAMPGWEDRAGVKLRADSTVLIDR